MRSSRWTNTPWQRQIVGALSAGLALMVLSAARAEPNHDRLFEDLQTRSDHTQSLLIRWTQTTTRWDSKRPTSQQAVHEVRLKGDLVDHRYSRYGTTELALRSLWNGSDSRQLTPPSGGRRGSLLIEKQIPYAHLSNHLNLRPVFANYRPLHPHMGALSAERYRRLPGEFTAGDHRCCVIAAAGEASITVEYWFDEEHPFLLRRYISRIDGKDSIRLNITYREDARHGLVPASWNAAFRDQSGALSVAHECRVERFEPNIDIDPLEFVLEPADLDEERFAIVEVSGGKKLSKTE